MKIKKIFIFIFLINLLFLKQSLSQDIPVIVIVPGKTPQSLSTVGSSVTIIDEDKIIDSSHFSFPSVRFDVNKI